MENAEKSYGRDQVIQIINSVVSKVESTDKQETANSILSDLNALKAIIDEARTEIGSTRPKDINDKHIPTATDELDAVVEATAEASGTIMDSCDVIQEQTSKMDSEAARAIDEAVIKIFEACSFQDITGQRINKVVTTLKTIDEKVSAMLEVLSESLHVKHTETGEEEEIPPEKKLLNGPQLPENAITQSDIDKLLESF